MDFHGLMRRDLQSLCKRNKIPANMTNVAMADALKALEIVEGLDEYMNQSDSNAPQSQTAVAKQPPKTVTRTTRRKTTTKPEPQPSSKLVASSCQLKKKNLAGEMEQESKTNKLKIDANVGKTPAARGTRKASAATSCVIKVQESKKNEPLQSVYSTRRSTRLLGKVMGGLSLETKETLDKPEENEGTEQVVSAQENTPAADSEDEVIPSRDLSVSMEKEWEMSKNNSDHEIGDLGIDVDLGDNTETNIETTDEVIQGKELSASSMVKEGEMLKNDSDKEVGDLGDIAVLDANTETSIERMDEVIPCKELSASSIEKEWEMLKNDSDKEVGDIVVLDANNTETNIERMDEVMGDEKEPKDSFVQVNKQEQSALANKAMCEERPEKDDNDQQTGDLQIYVDANTATDNDMKEPNNVLAVEQQDTEEAIQENDSKPEKNDTFDEDTVVALTGSDDVGDSETAPEKIFAFDGATMVEQTGTDAGDSETEPEKIFTFDEDDAMVDQTGSDGDSETKPEEDNSGVDATGNSEPKNVLAVEQVNQQETEAAIQERDFEHENFNTTNEDAMVVQAGSDGGDSEIEPEGDNCGVDADDTISEADSNRAVLGSDEEMIVSESEGSLPLIVEEAEVKTTPFSPISVQFPRPTKSATPSKNSALKLVNVENMDKENNMVMMNVDYGEAKKKKKKKKVAIDEEKLKEVSIRQLVKMVKELSLKSTSRTALQILPGNNQTAE